MHGADLSSIYKRGTFTSFESFIRFKINYFLDNTSTLYLAENGINIIPKSFLIGGFYVY